MKGIPLGAIKYPAGWLTLIAITLVVILAFLPNTGWADNGQGDGNGGNEQGDGEGENENNGEITITNPETGNWECVATPGVAEIPVLNELQFWMSTTCNESMSLIRHTFIVQQWDPFDEIWEDVDNIEDSCNSCTTFRSPNTGTYVQWAFPGESFKIIYFLYACSPSTNCNGASTTLGPFDF